MKSTVSSHSEIGRESVSRTTGDDGGTDMEDDDDKEMDGFSDGDVIVMKQMVPLDKVDNRIVMEEVPEFKLVPRPTPDPVVQSDVENEDQSNGHQSEAETKPSV